MPSAASPTHPPIGTLIDGGSLELVEVLGVGGYGVVYRALDIRSSSPKSYAVKCLVHADGGQQMARRQLRLKEIKLHQRASSHPGVVTLHRVIEEYNRTYLIMDYAPDHDLFTQILNNCRYLGDDGLIKHVFLQLLDSIEFCHSLGIYHRDLKPENVLCFDGGFRVAVTDFGLATTDRLSEEFRTGSVFHMSPECHGGDFVGNGAYSPMFNDVWSLGIILLNLATGRNPWKSATADDPTFQAYLRKPMTFLPTVLPISHEINEILIRALDVDWRQRMTIPELREAIEEVTSFYSDDVVFEGNMAKCPWELTHNTPSAKIPPP
ncbi:kinase-like domain-containing protein [Infundibulicybe gibba]|nr:kinase-like domain-containing protein [Infundibulicybe gibba]